MPGDFVLFAARTRNSNEFAFHLFAMSYTNVRFAAILLSFTVGLGVAGQIQSPRPSNFNKDNKLHGTSKDPAALHSCTGSIVGPEYARSFRRSLVFLSWVLSALAADEKAVRN